MIWVLIAVGAIGAAAALLWPLFKPPVGGRDRAAYDLVVFQDQLKEVDRDLERGVLTETEAGAARLEIQRRILAAARTPAAAPTVESPLLRGLTAGVLAVGVPALAVGVYLIVGTPGLPGTRPSAAPHGDSDADIARMVNELAAKVAASPKDPDGLVLLARSYRQLGRYGEAADIYRRLVALQPNAENYASLGEAATAAADGDVTPDAHAALFKALTLDRTEPRARFYIGLEFAEKGDANSALAVWRDLTASTPPDAPWLGMVRQEMAQVAQDANIPPMAVQPKHPLDLLPPDGEIAAANAAPTQSMAAAAPAPSAVAAPAGTPPGTSQAGDGQFTPEQRQMVEGMVGGLAVRLEQNPQDFDGWMMLGRSYTVLHNPDGAAKAYEKAVALKPLDLQPKLQYVAALLSASGPDAMPPTLIRTLADILALDPKQPEALYLSGVARAKAGDKKAAREFWTRATAVAPDGSPMKAEIARLLKTVE